MDGDRGVYLGHRRLAILDLTDASAQPMTRDGVALTYNGEIYNHQDLRNRLRGAGVTFRSTGDVEVVLEAWRTWHEEMLEHLDGMFAFAVWDGHRAIAATDPFGEKPLYFTETRDGVYLCSELGPLVGCLKPPPRLEGANLVALLTVGCIPAPETAFAGVKRCTPGTKIIVRAGKVESVRRYWSPPIGTPGRRAPQPLGEVDLDRIEDVLADSIRTRLHADVPVCAFLSSGVDSSLIVALAKRLGRDVPCITVAFSQGRSVDESLAAGAIARHLGLPHEVLAGGNPEADAANSVLSLFGQPNDNLTALSVRDMSRLARARFKVALTGLGGDELFYGYRKHLLVWRLRRLLESPESLRLAAGAVAHRLRAASGKFGAFADLVGVRGWELVAAHKTIGILTWLRELPGWAEWAQSHFAASRTPVILRVPEYDVSQTMPDSLLPAQDLGSMAESLELRSPFLNRRLADQMAQFDPRSLLGFGRKSVLYRLLERHVPAALTLQRKVGFIFPHDRFLAAMPKSVPVVPGVEPSMVRTAWRRRGRGGGWLRLSVRLALAAAFQDGLARTMPNSGPSPERANDD